MPTRLPKPLALLGLLPRRLQIHSLPVQVPGLHNRGSRNPRNTQKVSSLLLWNASPHTQFQEERP